MVVSMTELLSVLSLFKFREAIALLDVGEDFAAELGASHNLKCVAGRNPAILRFARERWLVGLRKPSGE